MPLLVIPYPAFDPVLVRLGPLAIHWYALAYIFGILVGWAYARLLIHSEKLWGGKAPMTVADFDDFVLWVTLGIIMGPYRLRAFLQSSAFHRAPVGDL